MELSVHLQIEIERCRKYSQSLTSMGCFVIQYNVLDSETYSHSNYECRRGAMMPNQRIKAAAEINDSPYQVQVLDRALGILDSLSNEGPELGPAELSEMLKLHKSTVHRLLMVLERHRLIERGPQNGKYRLGMKLFELG